MPSERLAALPYSCSLSSARSFAEAQERGPHVVVDLENELRKRDWVMILALAMLLAAAGNGQKQNNIQDIIARIRFVHNRGFSSQNLTTLGESHIFKGLLLFSCSLDFREQKPQVCLRRGLQ